MDTWTHQFVYKSEWDIGGHCIASLPVQPTQVVPGEQYLAGQYYGGLVDTPEDVLEVEDMPAEGPAVAAASIPM